MEPIVTVALIAGIVTLVTGLVKGVGWWLERKSTQKQQRRSDLPHAPVLILEQDVLIKIEVPITQDSINILEIPRSKTTSILRPTLIIPQQGIVKRKTFTEQAIDENVFRAEAPTACTGCSKDRRVGALLNQRWFCVNCYGRILRKYAYDGNGPADLMRFAVRTADVKEFTRILQATSEFQSLSKYQIIQDLARCSPTLR